VTLSLQQHTPIDPKLFFMALNSIPQALFETQLGRRHAKVNVYRKSCLFEYGRVVGPLHQTVRASCQPDLLVNLVFLTLAVIFRLERNNS
jgi:hypothetical protein